MQYDVICIGAGVLGTFHAYHAALKGKKVLLIERDARPNEATVRNFGQVVPSGQEIHTWRKYGMDSLKIYKSIQEKFDISVRANGSTYLASDEQEMQLLEEMHEIDRRMDYISVLMTRQELMEKYPSLQTDYIKGGLYYPDEISVEPHRMIHRLIEFVKQVTSIDFRNNTAVTHCDSTNGHCTIVTSAGEKYTAKKVIVCSGREFKTLFPEIFLKSGMEISKLQMMLLAPMQEVKLPGNILTGLSIRRYEAFHSCPSYEKFNVVPKDKELHDLGIHILFKQAEDGSVILGDSHEYAPAFNLESLDFSISAHINELMIDEAKRIMNFPHWKMAKTWAGYYATHPDEIFEHTIDNRIHIVTGIGGKGMTCSAGFSKQNIQKILSN